MRVHTYVKLFVDVICVIDAEADAEGIKSSPPFRLIRPMDRERFNNSTQRAPLCGVSPSPTPGEYFFSVACTFSAGARRVINKSINIAPLHNGNSITSLESVVGKTSRGEKAIEKHCHEGITALIAADAIDR